MVRLSPLDVAELAAFKYGFDEIDMEDNDDGNYRIVARSKNRTCTGRGATVQEAVEKLLRMFDAN